MSKQFLYPELQLVPKNGVATLPLGESQQVVLELPRKLIEDWKKENRKNRLLIRRLPMIIGRVVVADAICSFPHPVACEFDVPTWLKQRHPVMNARACDHHDNGIRAWVVKSSDHS
jgi:hypothetical protein